MTRLQSEFQRLYRPDPQLHGRAASAGGTEPAVRALVLELVHPAGWSALGHVWRGVQAELDLPAPAIAVSGTDGLQLWFSVAAPVPARQARAFLEGLRRRFLPDVDARRVRLLLDAPPVPAEQAPSGNWSAFVAPDLAPVFDDTPWLDIPPNEEGQAALLGVLQPMTAAAFEAALQILGPVAAPSPHGAGAEAPSAEPGAAASGDPDPCRFLQQVMQDEGVALALRIEAAKALLQHSSR